MARTFEENMNDKKLTVKSLRVLQEVEGGAFDKISSQIEETNQTIATLQGAQNRYWDSIADDNIITVEEKRILYKEKQSLDTEYSIVIQNAEKNKDYVDYTSLVEAYQNLNSYLAFIKVFENLGSNTKIDNRTEFYDAFDSYYIALNNVNQSILNKASVGDLNVENPDKITGLKAVASEKGIYVSFNQLSSEVKNNIGKYIYKLNKGDGVIYFFESQANGFTYEFDRLVDGFPEADDIKDWEWCVSAVSVYGKENEESNIATVNVDTYGTWIPNKDDINIIVSSNKRQISLSFNRIITSKILYGQIQYGLLVQRIDIDEENFYTPALDKNPALSEENYKQETTEPLYVTSYFSQTVPLAGQNNKKWRKKYYETRKGEDGTKANSVSYSDTLPAYPDNAVITYDDKGNIIGVSYNDAVETFTQHYEYTLVDMPSPVDTTYKYKIDVWNKDTDLHYDILNSLAVIATANSASDLVDNAITQNALAPDAVTADKIAAGTITAEQIAAENILAKGARAGMVSTEGLQVDDSGFFASEPFNYKYHDPETGAEKSYPTSAGEFFVGNSPDVNDSRDVSEFLHYKKGEGGGFWLKIKNFIVKGLSTIINGVFVVKKTGETDSNAFFVANATDDSATGVAGRTVSVNGALIIKGVNLVDRLYFNYNNYQLPNQKNFFLQLCPLRDFDGMSLEVLIRIHGSDVSSILSVKFIGAMSIYESSVEYSYEGYNTSAIEIFPLLIKDNATWAANRAFGIYVYNKLEYPLQTLSVISYKLNDRYYNPAESSIFRLDSLNNFTLMGSKFETRACKRYYFLSNKTDLDEIYPIGSIYMSVNSTSPATLFGGYWVRLKDRFLVGANDISGSAFAPGAMAGKSVITNVPAHTHEISMDSDGVHWHKTYGNNSATKTSGVSYMLGGSGTTIYKNDNPGYCETDGSHSHKLYIKETGSVSVNILPPYLAVYMWKRVSAEEAATLSIT